MNFKNHPRTYEYVFSVDPPKSKNKIDLKEIIIEGMDTDEYTSFFKDFIKDFYDDLFLQIIKLSWLRKKFTYGGLKMKIPIYFTNRRLVGKFTKYLRRYVGHDLQIITKTPFFPKIETFYLETFFPEFMERNPFTDSEYYKFPYKNISLEYLVLIYQLDDRFHLLDEAEKQKMSYAVFVDYVLNHILVENEILGEDRYSFQFKVNRQLPCFFKDSHKKFIAGKGEKRT